MSVYASVLQQVNNLLETNLVFAKTRVANERDYINAILHLKKADEGYNQNKETLEKARETSDEDEITLLQKISENHEMVVKRIAQYIQLAIKEATTAVTDAQQDLDDAEDDDIPAAQDRLKEAKEELALIQTRIGDAAVADEAKKAAMVARIAAAVARGTSIQAARREPGSILNADIAADNLLSPFQQAVENTKASLETNNPMRLLVLDLIAHIELMHTEQKIVDEAQLISVLTSTTQFVKHAITPAKYREEATKLIQSLDADWKKLGNLMLFVGLGLALVTLACFLTAPALVSVVATFIGLTELALLSGVGTTASIAVITGGFISSFFGGQNKLCTISDKMTELSYQAELPTASPVASLSSP